MKPTDRTLPLVLAGVLFLVLAFGCSTTPPDRIAFNTIDDAVTSVQTAAAAYRRHCGLKPGDPGPGTCDLAEYTVAFNAYAKFQQTANSAVDVAARTPGETPLQIISSAATAVLNLYAGMKGGAK